MGDSMKARKEKRSSTTSLFAESVSTSLTPVKSSGTAKTYEKSIKKHLIANATLSFIAILIAVWENDAFHSDSNPGSTLIASLRCLVLGITVLQLSILIQSHNLSSKEADLGLQNPISPLWLAVEIAMTVPVSIPFYDFSLEMQQLGKEMTITLDDILVPFTCLRAYHVIKLIGKLTFLAGDRAKFHRKMNQIEDELMFVVKGLVQGQFVKLSLCIMIADMCLGGFLLRVFERSISDTENMSSVTNDFWLIELSERTIGYGDLVPETHIGRLIIIICVFVGIFNLSLVVSWINDITTLSQRELFLSAKILVHKQSSSSLRNHAASLIQLKWRLYTKRKAGLQRFPEFVKFLMQSWNFKFERSLWQVKHEPTFRQHLGTFDTTTRLVLFSLITDFHPAKEYGQHVMSHLGTPHLSVR